MNNLIAKPIIKDQYWVITDGTQKIGNLVAEGSGLNLKINGKITHFTNVIDLKNKTKIEFQTLKTDKSKIQLPFANYPTPQKIYNSIVDIQKKLHIFTTSPKSKCYYAAGWFVINQNEMLEKTFCPKYIFLRRYPYYGPFKTEQEVDQYLNTTQLDDPYKKIY